MNDIEIEPPILVLVALEDELPQALSYPYVKVITGVGKVKAAIATTDAIIMHDPRLVINFGTAGCLDPSIKPGLYPVSVIRQRDMDVRGLGVPLGTTPFTGESDLAVGTMYDEGLILSTGDNFVESQPELKSQLVDMEAYAIAMACRENNVPLNVYKYISDYADEEANTDWKENCAKGAELFLKVINA